MFQTATAIVGQTELAIAISAAQTAQALAAASAQPATLVATSPVGELTPAIITRTSTPLVPTIPPTPAPTAVIAAEYPARMNTNTSDTIIVILKLAGGPTPTVTGPGRTTVAAPQQPVGTPGAALPQAFGSNYEAVAVAKLGGTNFDATSVDEEQSLDQSEVTWTWNISPKKAGSQKVNIVVTGEWRPRDGGEIIKHKIWQRALTIDVQEPWLTRGQINLSSLLFPMIGSGLSLPWLITQLRAWAKRRAAQRRRLVGTKRATKHKQ